MILIRARLLFFSSFKTKKRHIKNHVEIRIPCEARHDVTQLAKHSFLIYLRILVELEVAGPFPTTTPFSQLKPSYFVHHDMNL